MKARILWIEGKRAESPHFISYVSQEGYHVVSVSSGKQALETLPEFGPDLVVLNAASMQTSGKRICRLMREASNGVPLLVISDPDFDLPSSNEANVVLTLPFTKRKLMNRIVPLLPGESDKLLHLGPIHLDLERKQVSCLGKLIPLTPRLIQLLRYFMEHAGEALMREAIFREVWVTEYTGDTRTLDVHISWLRQAIEKDPRNPRFLKTIRGIGYRLDV